MNKHQTHGTAALITGGRKKIAGYSSATLHAKRDSKRREAEARQRSYDALTLDEKLEAIADRPGTSARELARLTLAR
jgi:hypothetical protein